MRVESEACYCPKTGCETFTSVTVLPALSYLQVEDYFIKYGRIEGVQRVKARDKGRKMFEEICVEACSVLIQDGKYFISGLVAASMKKYVNYWTKLSFTLQGELQHTKCECAAGAGPHACCKHLACMAFMLSEASHSGQVLMKKTCTEQLQTFHQPSKKREGISIFIHKLA